MEHKIKALEASIDELMGTIARLSEENRKLREIVKSKEEQLCRAGS